MAQGLRELHSASSGFAEAYGALVAHGQLCALQGGRRPPRAEAVGPADDKAVQPRTDQQQVARIVGSFKRAALGLSVADLAAVQGKPELADFKDMLSAIHTVLSGYGERFPSVAQSATLTAQAVQSLPDDWEEAGGPPGSSSSNSGDGAGSSSSAALAPGQLQPAALGPPPGLGGAAAASQPSISLGLGCRAMPLGPHISPRVPVVGTGRVCDLQRPFAALAGATRKLRLHMVGMSYVQGSVVGPGGQQHKLTAGLDNGCTIECCSEDWFLSNWQRFLYEGSSAQLCELEQPLTIGMFAGQHTCQATHCVLGLPLQLGKGVYPIDALIVKGGNFNLVLGNSFMFNYAARLWQRDFNDRAAGRYLILPLPQRLCQPGVTAPQRPAKHSPHWYPQQHIPLHYDVCEDTLAVRPVSEYPVA